MAFRASERLHVLTRRTSQCALLAKYGVLLPEHYLDKRDIRRTDRFVQFALAASQDALQDAGLTISDANAERVGVYIGSAFGGLESVETVHRQLLEKGPNRVSPLFPAIVLGNLASGQVSIHCGASGPNNSSCTACAAGAHSIGEAFHLIARGAADAMITRRHGGRHHAAGDEQLWQYAGAVHQE